MIPVRNIYYMLAYAFQCLSEQGYRKMATEEFENVGELCAAILSRGVSSLLKQGLGREYLPQTDTLSTLKGKVDYTQSIKENTMLNNQMVCTYDEFSENTYFNRILKTTMLYLLRSDISKTRKRELRKVIIFFSNVDELDWMRINWKVHFTKNNRTYQMLIAVCELVLKGLLQTQSDGSVRMMDFLDEQHMHHLYEKFLLEFYRQERGDLTANAPHIPWALDDDYSVMLPTMKTDITLTKGNRTLIIDAKYYARATQQQFNSQTIHSGNLYQIFTYVKNKKEQVKDMDGEVSGLLLYARTDENVVPENQVYSMSGNRITVHSLDLNRDFDEIKDELNRIADTICS